MRPAAGQFDASGGRNAPRAQALAPAAGPRAPDGAVFRWRAPAHDMTLEWADILMRLGAAAGVGMLLGANRDLQNKPIGARTLGLVGLGTATTVVATIQFPGMAENPDAASRVIQGIIQGIMAGISFIGAGVILRDSSTQTVRGLTTAATVWVTAALGIACGLAAWRTVAVAAAAAMVLLVAVAWIESALSRNHD
jgi:putative Mg2+ transporter-C (MgtC) family protein